ncbi:MAG TPA: RNA chaperone Hfq [Terracidiphilus sp.]|jgi:sRNA-binding regulator protein Hfq|nr:RNA chaperone Hfq [Terracidiphilus sp.]
MTNESALAHMAETSTLPAAASAPRTGRKGPVPQHLRHTHYSADAAAPPRQAELFYLQKQIQAQTPMVIVLEDGQHVEGVIEWYDWSCLKIRGREKSLVYKSAIKYMHKLGEGAL